MSKPKAKKNTTPHDLLSCYKCGSKPIPSNSGDDHEETYFSCGNYTQCDVVGPTCDSFTEAASQWNELVRISGKNATTLARYAAAIRAITLLRDAIAPPSAREELASTIIADIDRLRGENERLRADVAARDTEIARLKDENEELRDQLRPARLRPHR